MAILESERTWCRVILIVEDNVTSRDLLERALRLAGHEVYAAESGRQAFDVLKRERPAVIVADLMMPGMDGCDLQRIMRERPELSDIPLIIISTALDFDERGKELNARVCLAKPVDLNDILRYTDEYDPVIR